MAKKTNEQSNNKLQEVLDKLNKQYGQGTILNLGEKQIEYDVIPSGSIGLDYITLGIGGFAKGKLYELMGWEGVGKSSICGHAVAECQKKGGKVLYIDGENAVDIDYFKALGVNPNEMMIVQPSNGEEGFNIALELIQTGEFSLVIIDSDSSLLPKAVIDGEVGDHAIGKKAKLNSNAYPKLKGVLAKFNTCVIVVSQYREKIGVMFGNPTTTTGGHALKFYSDCRIEISRSLAKEGDNVYGNTTKMRAIKNKMFSPYRKSSFDIVFGKGIDKIGELMELASDYEIVKKWGKTITYEETKYDLVEFTNMLSDNSFFEEIRNKVVEKVKNAENKPIEEDEVNDY